MRLHVLPKIFLKSLKLTRFFFYLGSEHTNMSMIAKYEAVMTGMNMEWPALKEKLLTNDSKCLALMQDYHAAFVAYDAVMDDRKGELRRLNRAYGHLVNYLYGPIMRVEE